MRSSVTEAGYHSAWHVTGKNGLRFGNLAGILSSTSKTKPVASVSGQSSGCCITPTGYRSHRVVTNGVQPLNLSQVSTV